MLSSTTFSPSEVSCLLLSLGAIIFGLFRWDPIMFVAALGLTMLTHHAHLALAGADTSLSVILPYLDFIGDFIPTSFINMIKSSNANIPQLVYRIMFILLLIVSNFKGTVKNFDKSNRNVASTIQSSFRKTRFFVFWSFFSILIAYLLSWLLIQGWADPVFGILQNDEIHSTCLQASHRVLEVLNSAYFQDMVFLMLLICYDQDAHTSISFAVFLAFLPTIATSLAHQTFTTLKEDGIYLHPIFTILDTDLAWIQYTCLLVAHVIMYLAWVKTLRDWSVEYQLLKMRYDVLSKSIVSNIASQPITTIQTPPNLAVSDLSPPHSTEKVSIVGQSVGIPAKNLNTSVQSISKPTIPAPHLSSSKTSLNTPPIPPLGQLHSYTSTSSMTKPPLDRKKVGSKSYLIPSGRTLDLSTGVLLLQLRLNLPSILPFRDLTHGIVYLGDSIKLCKLSSPNPIVSYNGHIENISKVSVVYSISFEGISSTTNDSLNMKIGTNYWNNELRCPNVLISSSHDKTVKFWDIVSGKCLATIEIDDGVSCFEMFSNGTKILIASTKGSITLWSIESIIVNSNNFDKSTETSSLSHKPKKPSPSFSPSNAPKRIIKCSQIGESFNINTWASITALAVFPDGEKFACSTFDGSIYLWNIEQHTVEHIMRKHTKRVLCLAIHSDQERLLSASEDRTLIDWDLTTGTILHEFEGHVGSIQCAHVYADDQFAISGDDSGLIIVWDLTTPQNENPLVTTMDDHSAAIISIHVFEEDSRLVSYSLDKDMKIWNMYDGEVLDSIIVPPMNPLSQRRRHVPINILLVWTPTSLPNSTEISNFFTHQSCDVALAASKSDLRRLLKLDETDNVILTDNQKYDLVILDLAFPELEWATRVISSLASMRTSRIGVVLATSQNLLQDQQLHQQQLSNPTLPASVYNRDKILSQFYNISGFITTTDCRSLEDLGTPLDMVLSMRRPRTFASSELHDYYSNTSSTTSSSNSSTISAHALPSMHESDHDSDDSTSTKSRSASSIPHVTGTNSVPVKLVSNKSGDEFPMPATLTRSSSSSNTSLATNSPPPSNTPSTNSDEEPTSLTQPPSPQIPLPATSQIGKKSIQLNRVSSSSNLISADPSVPAKISASSSNLSPQLLSNQILTNQLLRLQNQGSFYYEAGGVLSSSISAIVAQRLRSSSLTTNAKQEDRELLETALDHMEYLEQMFNSFVPTPFLTLLETSGGSAVFPPIGGQNPADDSSLSTSISGKNDNKNVSQKATDPKQVSSTSVPPDNDPTRNGVSSDISTLISSQALTQRRLRLGDAISRGVTVMFSDIRDFSKLSESMPATELMDFLNTYLAFAMPSIYEAGGFVDKFIGDATMCIFDQAGEEQAIASVKCAVKMMSHLRFMKKNGFTSVETGIGINTGRCVIGLVGTENRMEATVIGDTVNLASRLESLCKVYGVHVLIGESTKHSMGTTAATNSFCLREIDWVAVKGKSIACRIYEVIDADPPEHQDPKQRMLPLWSQAIMLYQNAAFSQALPLFQQCLKIFSEDTPSKIYIERCEQLISKPPKNIEQWDPVRRFNFK